MITLQIMFKPLIKSHPKNVKQEKYPIEKGIKLFQNQLWYTVITVKKNFIFLNP